MRMATTTMSKPIWKFEERLRYAASNHHAKNGNASVDQAGEAFPIGIETALEDTSIDLKRSRLLEIKNLHNMCETESVLFLW